MVVVDWLAGAISGHDLDTLRSRCFSCTLPFPIRDPCKPSISSSLQELCLGIEMIIILFSALLARPWSVWGEKVQ